MKVLIVSREIPPHGGGAGVVALNYCKAFIENGVETTIITTQPKVGLFDSFDKLKLISFPATRFLWVYHMAKALIRISLQSFDKIIINDVAAAYVTGIVFSEKELSKSFVFLHGSESENIYNTPSLLHRIMFYPYFFKRVIKYSNRIIAVSHFMKDKFVDETNFSDKDRISVVHNGMKLPTNPVTVVNSEFRGFTLLTVSRLEEGKGFREMFKVLEPVLLSDSSLQWVIVGKGAFFDEFSHIISGSRVRSQISLKGYVDNERLSSYYLTSDLFILLSNYKESLGLVYIEAQAFGCPAVGYNRYGVRETIVDGITGFLINDAEDLVEIIKEKKHLSLSKADILLNSQMFSLEHMYEKFLEVSNDEK